MDKGPDIIPHKLQISKNTFPRIHLGIGSHGMMWGINPEIKDGLLNLTVIVKFNVTNNGTVLFEFITTKTFIVHEVEDKPLIFHLTCDLVTIAIKETNIEFGKLESTLAFGYQYPIPSFTQIYPNVVSIYKRFHPEWIAEEPDLSSN